MKKIMDKMRVISLISIIALAMVFSILRLMKIQIVEGKDLLLQSINKSMGAQELIAPRGEIIDLSLSTIV